MTFDTKYFSFHTIDHSIYARKSDVFLIVSHTLTVVRMKLLDEKPQYATTTLTVQQLGDSVSTTSVVVSTPSRLYCASLPGQVEHFPSR